MNSGKCPNCGAQLNNLTKQYKCDYCGSRFDNSASLEDSQASSKDIDPEMAKYIEVHRKLQAENSKYKSTTGEYNHPNSILDKNK